MRHQPRQPPHRSTFAAHRTNHPTRRRTNRPDLPGAIAFGRLLSAHPRSVAEALACCAPAAGRKRSSAPDALSARLVARRHGQNARPVRGASRSSGRRVTRSLASKVARCLLEQRGRWAGCTTKLTKHYYGAASPITASAPRARPDPLDRPRTPRTIDHRHPARARRTDRDPQALLHRDASPGGPLRHPSLGIRDHLANRRRRYHARHRPPTPTVLTMCRTRW